MEMKDGCHHFRIETEPACRFRFQNRKETKYNIFNEKKDTQNKMKKMKIRLNYLSDSSFLRLAYKQFTHNMD